MWHWYVLFFFSLHVAQIRLLISVADAMQLKMSCSSFVLCTRTYKVCNVAAYLRIQLTRILRYLFAVYFCFSIYTWEEFATLFEPNERNVKNLFKKHIQLTSVWASLSLSFPPFLTLWFYFYDAFNSKHQAVSRFECPSWRSDSRAADSERKKNY